AAAELARHAATGLHDGTDALAVDGPAFLGAVEIDQMQIRGAVRDPALRNGRGIGVEDGFLAVIALPQANALAAAQVDRWVDLHYCSSDVSYHATRRSFVFMLDRARSKRREVLEHRQPHLLAFLRMKLCRTDIVDPDCRRERRRIIGLGSDNARIL